MDTVFQNKHHVEKYTDHGVTGHMINNLTWENYFKSENTTSKCAVKMWRLSLHERLIEMKTVSPMAIALAAAKL